MLHKYIRYSLASQPASNGVFYRCWELIKDYLSGVAFIAGIFVEVIPGRALSDSFNVLRKFG